MLTTQRRTALAGICCFLLSIAVCAIFPLAVFAAEPSVSEAVKQTVEFQKGVPVSVRVINDGKADPGPWLLEITPPNGPQTTLRLPLTGGEFSELQAASFVSPEKQELFISFTEVRNGVHAWCYVVDFSDGAAAILFDSDWTHTAFRAQGSFVPFYRVEVYFPEFFDRYTLFIEDAERESDYTQAGIFNAATGHIVTPREIYGSYLTAASLAARGPNSLSGLQLSFAVAGAGWIDVLGTYGCRLQYHNDKWDLQGDMQLEGIKHHRTEEGIPVKDMRLAWTMRGVEKKIPMPFATVHRIEGRAAFDALQKGYAVVGDFEEIAHDIWCFIPFVTPTVFTVYGTKDTGGQLELTGVQEQHTLTTGQIFVYPRTWHVINEDGDLEKQYVISIRHGDGEPESLLWTLPKAGDTATYLLRPGFLPHKE